MKLAEHALQCGITMPQLGETSQDFQERTTKRKLLL